MVKHGRELRPLYTLVSMTFTAEYSLAGIARDNWGFYWFSGVRFHWQKVRRRGLSRSEENLFHRRVETTEEDVRAHKVSWQSGGPTRRVDIRSGDKLLGAIRTGSFISLILILIKAMPCLCQAVRIVFGVPLCRADE